MLTIKVLGPGCRNCEMLARRTAQALEALAPKHPAVNEAPIEKITNNEEFLQYGLMFTPGLVINDKLVCSGRVPAVSQIKEWLQEALATPV